MTNNEDVNKFYNMLSLSNVCIHNVSSKDKSWMSHGTYSPEMCLQPGTFSPLFFHELPNAIK